MKKGMRDNFDGCKVRKGKGIQYPIFVEDTSEKVILSIIINDEHITKKLKKRIITDVGKCLKEVVEGSSSFDEVLLWHGAFCYYCGRTTISVDSFVDDLVRNWDSFGNNLKYLIQRDLEKNFAQDDIDRREGRGVCRLGHDCDRLSWERVRKLYNVVDGEK